MQTFVGSQSASTPDGDGDGAPGQVQVPVQLVQGDARTVLARLPPASVDAVITSPPYWRQRRYLPPQSAAAAQEMGWEATPEAYVARLVEVFRLVRRMLRGAGCVWLNLGESYAAGGFGGGARAARRPGWRGTAGVSERSGPGGDPSAARGRRLPPPGYKKKDQTLLPFQVAHALRADGWYLRQTVIWAKPTAPEPPRCDRPSLAHEYLFLLTRGPDSRVRDPGEAWWHSSVWCLPRASARGGHGHVAAMPPELARRCVATLSRSDRAGDDPSGAWAPLVVLDPFCGCGTVPLAALAQRHGVVGIDLDPLALQVARQRLARLAGAAPGPGPGPRLSPGAGAPR